MTNQSARAFNQSAVPVYPEDRESFYGVVADQSFAACVIYDGAQKADLAMVSDILAREGGHVVECVAGRFGGGDRVYVWAPRAAFEALEALPGTCGAHPYQNWDDSQNAPRMAFHRS